MSVQSFVEAAKKLYQTGYYNEALCLVCIAIDACAVKDSSGAKVSERYKEFLRQHFRTITDVGFPGISANSIRIKVNTNISSLKKDCNGYVDMEQIIYHVLRCGLVHNCDIENSITFTEQTIVGDWNANAFYVPRSIIWGLIATIEETL